MRKLIALVLILIVTPFFTHSKKTLNQQVEEIKISNSKNPETTYWEYVKDRLFDGETTIFKKLEGPILFELHDNSTKADSLLVNEVLLDIRKILPQKKIGLFNDYIGTSCSELKERGFKPNDSIKNYTFKEIEESRIYLTFEPARLYKNENRDFIQLGDGHSIQTYQNIRNNNEIVSKPFMTVAMGDVFTHEQKKDYLKAGILRKLVFLQNDSFVQERSVFSKKEITGLDYFIKDQDVFLLQKLYADDFLEQFKDYLYTYYPWRYAYSFLHQKEMNVLAIGIVSVLGIIVFLLLFSLFQNKKFKYSFLNYYFPVVLIWAHLVNLKRIYTYFINFNTVSSWSSSVSFMLIAIPLFALVSTFVMWGLDKIFIKEQSRFNSKLVQKVFFTFIAFITPLLLIFFFDEHTTEGIDFFLPDLFLWIALAIGRGLLIYLNHISQSLVNEKDVELSRLKEINTQSELKLLQSHINPHFLYNALNSIAGLAYTSPEKTEKMALSLSNLFRYSITNKGQQMSTVKEEVLMVQNYLEIENIRFGARLKFTLNVDGDLEDEEIPMYILQPLVENAIKHGVSQIRGEGLIILEIKTEDDNLLIRVIDNGPDFSNGLVSGHGLQTVYDLLRLSYGDNASLQWENAPVKNISISIPKN